MAERSLLGDLREVAAGRLAPTPAQAVDLRRRIRSRAEKIARRALSDEFDPFGKDDDIALIPLPRGNSMKVEPKGQEWVATVARDDPTAAQVIVTASTPRLAALIARLQSWM